MLLPPQRAAFLDLNGTLVLPVQVESLRDHTLIPGAIEAVRLLNDHGFLCPVVTVQSRIARGVFTEEAFREWFLHLQNEFARGGATLLGPYICPHRSQDACACAKPASLLYEQAARDHHIDITASVVIGDTGGDIDAARRLGCLGYLVLTGWGASSLQEYRVVVPDPFIAADIQDAARCIVGG